ncbi:MAG: type II toxin-antitoxin system PemK/MazF family toxin [Planctomycetaceae bacterium]
MKVRRGDVVLVDYPYSDRSGSKKRPCVVVQSDRNNLRIDDSIVVMITSRTSHVPVEPTKLLIDVATPAGRQSGLLFTSAVQCENIATVDGSFVLRKIGTLPPDLMQQVNDCLKAALDIP